MKLSAVIIRDADAKMFTGFVKTYPGVCSQADNVDTLLKNLNRNLKLYFDYMQKSDVVLSPDKIISLK